MNKHIYLPLCILLAVLISSCQGSQVSQLEATNVALSTQVDTLISQITQQAVLPIVVKQESVSTSAPAKIPTEIPTFAPAAVPAQSVTVINSALIFSGSGTITPWTNKTAYPSVLFGAANVHMVCDPNGTTDGKVWIDKETLTASCGAKGESWTPWKEDITVGDHYIYTSNAKDTYEFWTIGSTPFTIRNKYSHSDFIFTINNPGIYTLSANLIKGQFNIYITCQQAQNFNYKITQSTSIPVVLNPATCEILIRDVEQAKSSLADIEVSLAFTK